MRVSQRFSRAIVCLCLTGITPVAAFGQATVEETKVAGGPLTGPPVLNAPFSADAVTTLRQTLSDGTQVERRATARYYRDSKGRVRVEQTIIGLEALNPAPEPHIRITVYPDPTEPVVYTLNPVDRTAQLGPRFAASLAIGGGTSFAVPLGGPRFLIFHASQQGRAHGEPWVDAGQEELLGTRVIGGVEAIGRRNTATLPAGQPGKDRPMQIVDELWESPELKLTIYARSSDPRTGVVEYQLTNISRVEPPPDLFQIPSDYIIGRHASQVWIGLEPAESPRRLKGARGGGRP